ncbi:MAG TPA: hypothetical protein VKE71_02175 [Candidatus Angelobacter sp.]|nr:hypothetical protein [Candidatus Angelobacter sp.]
MKTVFKLSLFFSSFLGLALPLAAQTLTGTVRNATTGKPSAGDDVILLRLGEGMEEEARARTDSAGAFALNMTSPSAQHLLRVLHQKVNYDRPLTGTAPLELTVYDAVAKVPGLAGNIGIAQIESDGKTLSVMEMYSITNASNPPVTQSNPRNYEISLPEKAVFDSAQAKGPKGIWVNVPPSPISGQKGKYGINFPLRPGDTNLKFAYHLADNGTTRLQLRLPYPITNFAVMHPPAMSFKSLTPGAFITPGVTNGFQIEKAVASPVVGDVALFEVSGAGKASPEAPAEDSGSQVPAPPPAAAAAQTPVDQSKRELWFFISGIVVIVVVGIFALRRMNQPAVAPASTGEPALEALKTEMFQLEADRLRGSISAEEYSTTKAALSQTLERILARKKVAAQKSH